MDVVIHLTPRQKRFRIDAVLGVEARCSKCKSWWPADSDFYYFQNDGQPHSWCIACYTEWRNARRKTARETTQSPAATGTCSNINREHF